MHPLKQHQAPKKEISAEERSPRKQYSAVTHGQTVPTALKTLMAA